MIDLSWKWRFPRTRKNYFEPLKEIPRIRDVLITIDTQPLSYGGQTYIIMDDPDKTMFVVGTFLIQISVNLLLKIFTDMWNENIINRHWFSYSKSDCKRIAEDFRERVSNSQDEWISEETIYGVSKQWKLHFIGSSIQYYIEAK